MRFLPALLTLFLFINACSVSRSVREPLAPVAPQRGMALFTPGEQPLLLKDSAMHGIAKVFRGTNFVQSGAFISDEGLFLTNYPVALEYYNNYMPGDNNWLETGFFAENKTDELPLPGIMLMVLIEQSDITKQFEDSLPENASNYEVMLAKQQLATKIIEHKKGSRNDLFVQVNEIHSGNKQLLSVYKILSDIRLVFAPPIEVSPDDLISSDSLAQKFSNQSILLRAYQPESGEAVGFSIANQPYAPEFHFLLAPEDAQTGISVALGYPHRTYRRESARAFQFYQQQTNPHIIKAYQAYLNKEDYLASIDSIYAMQTLANRSSISLTLNYYQEIMTAFTSDNVLEIKKEYEKDFQQWIETDTLKGIYYGDLMHFIDQAYDIAEQQGASFYTSSYIINLSALDDLVVEINNFLENSRSDISDEQLQTELQSVASAIKSRLIYINLEAELDLLKDFLLILASVPEDQQLFIINSIFSNTSPYNLANRAQKFIDNNGLTSVLFNDEDITRAIANETIRDDSLYILLDEILFINTMARNNQSIFMAYFLPVQQIYNRAQLEYDSLNIHPDANETLRYNIGSIKVNKEGANSRYIFSDNDFSGRAPGSILLNSEGKLIGLITDESSNRVRFNYFFNPTLSYQQGIRSVYIINELIKAQANTLLREMGIDN